MPEKKKKKAYSVEEDIERLGERGKKSKHRAGVKKKQAEKKAKKKKATAKKKEVTWLDKLKKKVAQYFKDGGT